MGNVSTSVQLIDKMTAPIASINNAINNMVSNLNSAENAANISSAPFV